jgi:hypothetical protein
VTRSLSTSTWTRLKIAPTGPNGPSRRGEWAAWAAKLPRMSLTGRSAPPDLEALFLFASSRGLFCPSVPGEPACPKVPKSQSPGFNHHGDHFACDGRDTLHPHWDDPRVDDAVGNWDFGILGLWDGQVARHGSEQGQAMTRATTDPNRGSSDRPGTRHPRRRGAQRPTRPSRRAFGPVGPGFRHGSRAGAFSKEQNRYRRS